MKNMNFITLFDMVVDLRISDQIKKLDLLI